MLFNSASSIHLSSKWVGTLILSIKMSLQSDQILGQGNHVGNAHSLHWKRQVKSNMLLCGIQYSSKSLYIEHMYTVYFGHCNSRMLFQTSPVCQLYDV